jgi:ABC-2 type transport system permease protein
MTLAEWKPQRIMSMSNAPAAPSAVEPLMVSGWRLYASQVAAVAGSELQKLRHDPLDIFTRAVQPVLWLLLFGGVMAHVRELGSGQLPYLDFLAAGILAQSVLFVAIFYGIAVIWERDLGILQRYLASPAPRSALVIGKALSASARGLAQAVFIYLLSLGLGVGVGLEPQRILGAVLVIILGASLFSTFSLVIASIVKTRERFMGIGQVLTMPIFFASNAIYPLALMPNWLRAISHANPLTYMVDALRALMIKDAVSEFNIAVDFCVLAVTCAVLVAIAARLYPSLAH